MNTTISNNGLPAFTSPSSSAGSGTPASVGTPVGAAAASNSGKPEDQVKLTDSALALQQAARGSEGAVVDHKKVEQIRQSIADGSYQVNPGRIAERMMSLEQQLGGAGHA